MHYPYKYTIEEYEGKMGDGVFFTSIHNPNELQRVAEDAARIEWLMGMSDASDWPITFILFHTIDTENELGRYQVSLDFHALFTAHHVGI